MQLDLFSQAKPDQYHWHLTGRHLSHEERGWPVARTHRIVIHYDGQCEAPTEAAAREIFERSYGKPDRHNQYRVIQGEVVRDEPPRRAGKKRPPSGPPR